MMELPFETVRTSRLCHRVIDVGDGPAVVMLHGFPEGAYSYRHQIPELVSAGYRVIAPNQRGYAGTDAPAEVEAYDMVELAADVVALLDALGVERAALVGHDFGAPVAWHTALLHPERVSSVVALSVPYGGRAPVSPISLMRKRMGDAFFYILYFQEPGIAEAELEADIRESLRRFYYVASGDAPPESLRLVPKTAKLFDSFAPPAGLPSFLTEADLDVYTSMFRESGFRAPLNWYRCMDRTWERTPHLDGRKILQPALYLAGERDMVVFLNQGGIRRMQDYVPQLAATRFFPGCGHWTQQERAAEVTSEILAFLRAR